MRLTSGLLAAALAIAPAIAAAQHDMAMGGHEAKHELGADITGFYQHLSLGGVSTNQVLVATPVDVRLGVGIGSTATIEPRITFAYHSKGNSNGGAAYAFVPDLNITWGFQSARKGPYLTAGGALRIGHDTSTVTQFGFNGGIGTRIPWESGAVRLEAFGQYFLKKAADNIPNELNIGIRIGLSLWH